MTVNTIIGLFAKTIGVAARRVRGTPIEPAARRLHGMALRILNRLRVYHLPDEVTLRVRDERHRFCVSTWFEYQQFEKYGSAPDGPVLERFIDDLRPDDTVWDVGANVGVFTVVAGGVCVDGEVIAFEPQPENVLRIKENLERNGRSATVRQLALSDDAGSAQFRVSSLPGEGAFGLLTDGDGDVSVQTARGDRLVDDGLAAPTVLKIDVQGSEISVLRGLKKTLPACRVIYANVYEKHFETEQDASELYGILQSAGFTVTQIEPWEGGHFIRAEREDQS